MNYTLEVINMITIIKEISHEDFVNGKVVTIKYNDINDKYYGCIDGAEVYTYTEEEMQNDIYVLTTLDNFERRLEKYIKILEEKE